MNDDTAEIVSLAANFRREVRNKLAEHGFMSNPCFTDAEILKGIDKVATNINDEMYKALKMWQTVWRTYAEGKSTKEPIDKAWKATAQAIGLA